MSHSSDFSTQADWPVGKSSEAAAVKKERQA